MPGFVVMGIVSAAKLKIKNKDPFIYICADNFPLLLTLQRVLPAWLKIFN